MRVLIVGGTGLISTGIIKHLLARGAEVTMFNRGQRENRVPAEVKHISGDRANLADFVPAFEKGRFDVVMDMICFTPQQAEASIAAFRGRCEHFIFCSTVCTYGVKVPSGVFVDESWPQEPISGYGRGKVACERLMMAAHERGDFKVTIIRPSSTYGPGGNLIDNIESSPVAWDRVEKGLPVLCAGDGLGLWVSTHRDDCGKLFAYAALNPKTYGQAYNATRQQHHTWRDRYATVAKVLGKPIRLLYMPAEWIVSHDPNRFGLLKEITQFHGAYNSSKARRDVPEFQCEIDFEEGARQTLEDIRRRGAWRSCEDDTVYESMVQKAMGIGVTPVEI
jgi:nucleoside-diphosphate-sugar epimerase